MPKPKTAAVTSIRPIGGPAANSAAPAAASAAVVGTSCAVGHRRNSQRVV